MDTEGGNFTTITSFNMEEGKREKKKEPKMSRGTHDFNLKLRIFITIFWLCVIALVEYLFIWKLFPDMLKFQTTEDIFSNIFHHREERIDVKQTGLTILGSEDGRQKLPGEIVGRVRIKIAFDNLSYTDDLASSDSVRYKNLSEEFIALVDRRLKNSSLADFYTRSEINGFENGSVIIKFSSTFKQRNRMLPPKNQVEDVLQNYIFPDKFNITLENTSVVVKSKPEIISYDLVRDSSTAIMTPSTPASADMTLTTTANMTDTTTTKSTTARTTSISGTTSSASITISLFVSTNSTTTTTTTSSTTSVSRTTSSAIDTP